MNRNQLIIISLLLGVLAIAYWISGESKSSEVENSSSSPSSLIPEDGGGRNPKPGITQVPIAHETPPPKPEVGVSQTEMPNSELSDEEKLKRTNLELYYRTKDQRTGSEKPSAAAREREIVDRLEEELRQGSRP